MSDQQSSHDTAKRDPREGQMKAEWKRSGKKEASPKEESEWPKNEEKSRRGEDTKGSKRCDARSGCACWITWEEKEGQA